MRTILLLILAAGLFALIMDDAPTTAVQPTAAVAPTEVAPAPIMPAPVTAATLPHLHPTQPTTGGDYARLGGVVRYCWFGAWRDEDRAVMVAGMDAWNGSGVRFVESDGVRDCTLMLVAEDWGDVGVGGKASMGPGNPGYITINSHYPLSMWTATHEAGHILGLLHWADGVMATDMLTLAPGPAEIDAVRRMWAAP